MEMVPAGGATDVGVVGRMIIEKIDDSSQNNSFFFSWAGAHTSSIETRFTPCGKDA